MIYDRQDLTINALVEQEYQRYCKLKQKCYDSNTLKFEPLETNENIKINKQFSSTLTIKSHENNHHVIDKNDNQPRKNMNSPTNINFNHQISFAKLANQSEQKGQNTEKIVQNYKKLLKELECQNFQQAFVKILQVKKADLFLKRVMEMSQNCLKEDEIDLNKCWKLIKQAVRQHSMARQDKN